MIQIPSDNIQRLQNLVMKANTIAVVTHTNPDGDTVGASLAIALMMQKLGKKALVIAPDNVPDFLSWLPGAADILCFDSEAKKAEKQLLEADLVFAMDYNAAHRTGKFSSIMEKVTQPKIMIDHHLYPDEAFCDLMFSYPESSSTSELLYHIFVQAEWSLHIDNSIASNIFVGIMTDTGSFAHSCDRKEVFEVTAQLINQGNLEVKKIHDLIYNNFKESRLRFLGYCIHEKLKVFPEKGAAYISVSLQDMEKFGVEEGDLEGIVNYALSIKGIEFAILLKEKEDFVKLSFRSKSSLDVNNFARSYFNGGGHFHAAGGRSYTSLEKTIVVLEELIHKL